MVNVYLQGVHELGQLQEREWGLHVLKGKKSIFALQRGALLVAIGNKMF